MPYQATNKNKNDMSQSEPSEQLETDEQAAENTVQGADLLLSLTKTARKNPIVTPLETAGSSADSSESRLKNRSLGMEPPSATVMLQPQHRVLYHSPIKIGSCSSGSISTNPCHSGGRDVMSSELAPYAMVPAWSPSLYNGMVPSYHSSFGRSSSLRRPLLPSRDSDSSTGNGAYNKRAQSDVEEKKEIDDVSCQVKKQRLISPSSSNEKADDEPPSESPSANKKCSWPLPLSHGPHPPPMYHVPPHWQHQLGYPPPHHMTYPHQLHPPYPMYSHYPPPWGMFGAPPPRRSPAMFSPTFPSQPQPPFDTAEQFRKKGKEVKCLESRDSPDCLDQRESPSSSSVKSLNRCVPLKHPMPKRLWSAANAERRLPDFSLLVNFPDHLSKGRNSEKNTQSTDGTKHCVMCGKVRLCSVSSASCGTAGGGRRSRSQPQETSGDTAPDDETTHIIPRQNKGVCTVCDVAVWAVIEHNNLEIKWCKGCKNFRPWAAFGDKGLATKCVRCRKRQKEKYATQKISGSRQFFEKPEDREHSSNMSVANDLRVMF